MPKVNALQNKRRFVPLCVNYKYEDDTALYLSVTSPNNKKLIINLENG